MGALGRILARLLVLASLGACESESPDIRHDAGAIGDAATTPEERDGAASCPPSDSSLHEPVETRCDGIDNDCDGLADFLHLSDENRCTPPPPHCAPGYAACVAGERVCLAAAPAPEVLDAEDNDCDGEIDEAAPAEVRVRALLLVPRYVAQEGGAALDGIASVLEQRGVPFDGPGPDQDFDDQLATTSAYPLVIVVGYLVEEYLTEHRQRMLEAYVDGGGTLVIFKPQFAAGSPAHALTGTVAIERRSDVEEIVFDGAAVPAARLFDSPQERRVPVTNEASPDATTWVHVMALGSADTDTVALASALVEGTERGAVIVRRSAGRGVVYSVGHDLHRFFHARCYVNCFEPSGDMAGLFLQEAFREATAGHVVLKHTVPGFEDSLAIVSHDVDARDAQHPGEWGEPGALQVAALEKQWDARGSFLVTTDYVADYFSPPMMRELCELGMCPIGVHSVVHSPDFDMLPRGTCEESVESYRPEAEPTLCGEVRVPIALIQDAIDHRPVAFRSPFLIVHPLLYDVLESQGIAFDSSYAVGDMKFNLPVSLARTGLNQHVFHRRELYTMPIALEDGKGRVIDGAVVREEMSEQNKAEFAAVWIQTMQRNADNAGHTMALLHPSYGLDVPTDNLRNKLDVLAEFLEACAARGVRTDLTMADVVEFWRGREGIDVEARYSSDGYDGTLTVGAHSVRDLTLEFGDALAEFRCDTCGKVDIKQKRVVLRDALEPGGVHVFHATPGL